MHGAVQDREPSACIGSRFRPERRHDGPAPSARWPPLIPRGNATTRSDEPLARVAAESPMDQGRDDDDLKARARDLASCRIHSQPPDQAQARRGSPPPTRPASSRKHRLRAERTGTGATAPRTIASKPLPRQRRVDSTIAPPGPPRPESNRDHHGPLPPQRRTFWQSRPTSTQGSAPG